MPIRAVPPTPAEVGRLTLRMPRRVMMSISDSTTQALGLMTLLGWGQPIDALAWIGPVALGAAATLIAAAVFYQIGRVTGRRSVLSSIQKEASERQLQTRRLEELLDASERARSSAESALGGSERRAAELARMFSVRGDFFANISHEFRTPLTLVIDPLETAVKGGYGPLDPVLAQRLGTALRNSRQVLRLINQLLDLAKVDAGKMGLKVKLEQVGSIINGVVTRFDSDADRRGVTLIFAPEEEMPPLYVDVEKIDRVVTNLISNALRATPSGGKVLVSYGRVLGAEGVEDGVEISVRDTGIGIPPDKLSFIFDRFYQLGSPSGQSNIGTGLGLAIAKEFVDLHGGQITAESVPGFGSTFSVRLHVGRDHLSEHAIEIAAKDKVGEESVSEDPDLVEQVASASASPGVVPDDDKSRPLILLVDDNADVRELLKDHLSSTYRLVESTDGLDGLQKARRLHPELIISDMIMPGMEGIALCRMVRQDKGLQHIPLILLTSLASDESRLEGIQVGVDAYITRPFNADELLATVENLIRTRRALRERYSQEVVLKPFDVAVPAAEQQLLEKVYEVIELHLEDTRFSVGQLAREVGLSESHLKRKLRSLIDEAPVELIRKIRIERAADLLKNKAGNVGDVAYATGFNNLSYFAKCFKERWGVSPSQFLAEAKAAYAKDSAPPEE